MKTLTVDLPDQTYRKLQKLRIDAKFMGKPWADFFQHLTRGVSLEPTVSDAISRATQGGLAKLWAENFILNLPLIVGDWDKYPEDKDRNSIGLLAKHKDEPALIIAAGPSVREKGHVKLLAERGWKGPTFATDRMLIPLLEAGHVPTYVMTVDGNRELIVKWYDNPLVDEHAKQITALFCSTAAPNAARRFQKAGGRLAWFHGMLDNFWQETDSVTSWLNYMTGSTAISAGGNVGATGFTLAYYLECAPIVYIGLDFGYTPSTAVQDTAYYKQLVTPGLSTEQIMGFYSKGWNPDFGVAYMTDVVFKHYREALFEMLTHANVQIFNATEGGAVHDAKLVKGIRFSEALDKYGER